MQNRKLALLLAALLCLPALQSHAQSVTPQKIVFTGAPQFSQAGLLAASGLKLNTPVTADDIKAAAQSLANTGFFSNTGFSYGNATLTYTLTPMARSSFLAARYDNLVWWTPDEIAAELHRRHPLFTTLVPQSGTMQDALVADITAMLAAKGITGTVTAIPSSSVANSMVIDSVRFTLSTPPVRVHAVQVSGLSPDLLPLLDSMRKTFVGQDYSTIDTPSALRDAATRAIQDDGYLEAGFDGFQQGAPAVTAREIDVDLSITGHAGDRYRIAAVNWQGGAHTMTQETFAKLCALKVGDAPSITSWYATRFDLEQAYSTAGYMAAKVKVDPVLDRTAHAVTYNVDVTPGPQYHFRTLTLAGGFTDKQKQELLSGWKMPPGVVYNGAYVKTFLTKNPSLHSLDDHHLNWKQSIDDNALKVDLELTLDKGAQ